LIFLRLFFVFRDKTTACPFRAEVLHPFPRRYGRIKLSLPSIVKCRIPSLFSLWRIGCVILGAAASPTSRCVFREEAIGPSSVTLIFLARLGSPATRPQSPLFPVTPFFGSHPRLSSRFFFSFSFAVCGAQIALFRFSSSFLRRFPLFCKPILRPPPLLHVCDSSFKTSRGWVFFSFPFSRRTRSLSFSQKRKRCFFPLAAHLSPSLAFHD